VRDFAARKTWRVGCFVKKDKAPRHKRFLAGGIVFFVIVRFENGPTLIEFDPQRTPKECP